MNMQESLGAYAESQRSTAFVDLGPAHLLLELGLTSIDGEQPTWLAAPWNRRKTWHAYMRLLEQNAGVRAAADALCWLLPAPHGSATAPVYRCKALREWLVRTYPLLDLHARRRRR